MSFITHLLINNNIFKLTLTYLLVNSNFTAVDARMMKKIIYDRFKLVECTKGASSSDALLYLKYVQHTLAWANLTD